MFEASEPFPFFDVFRVPYAVASGVHPTSCGRVSAGARSLSWPRDGADHAGDPALAATPFGRALPDEIATARLGPGWERDQVAVGEGIAFSIWRDRSGNLFLPFDPADVIRSFWSESYGAHGASQRLALRAYYRLRPLLPRALQIWLRRRYTSVQAKRAFPRWPVETALHDFYRFLFHEIAALVDEPVPWIAPWPDAASWALVLTHDVETEIGLRSIELLRDIELAVGVRSSWNLVPKRYHVDDETVAALTSAGFEVGVHGLYHDGRDLESERMLRKRLPEIRRYAERWRAVGFRSPATNRDWSLMPLLGFDYDSSFPDTDPFEPQAGGCCSLLPYFNGDLVELPITLPQDHTLFVLLGRADEATWVEKAEAIRAIGGMALLITHPDYMRSPHRMEAYRRFLERANSDERVWCALPREVSAWWRRRAASTLQRDGSGWKLVGPAAGSAEIRFDVPPDFPSSART